MKNKSSELFEYALEGELTSIKIGDIITSYNPIIDDYLLGEVRYISDSGSLWIHDSSKSHLAEIWAIDPHNMIVIERG